MSNLYIAGFGFRSNATLASLSDAFEKASGDFGASGEISVSRLAAPADKCSHPALLELSAALRLPLYPIGAEALRAKVTPTQSAPVLAARGTGSVAEACALIGANSGANNIKRHISQDRLAVCAIAAINPAKGDPE